MIQVNAMGDPCPIPIVKTKNAIREMGGPGVVETLVDNEIAVQNLTKMANQKGYGVKSEKLGPNQFKVTFQVEKAAGENGGKPEEAVREEACLVPAGPEKPNTVVAITSRCMGEGSEELGQALMKSYLFALTQLDPLPKTILFYNGGAFLTTEGSASLEDLKSLEAQGVEILTCGTCLNYYGLTDKLQVGDVSNMYDIVEKLSGADLIIRP